MFELSVAFKYLIPRWRQLSVSIISLISILVIALVVWLITVFFSVTQGLEKSWVQKLIALTAPVRIYPTEQYYNSFYYLSDSISSNSNYTLKSLGEKYSSPNTESYQPDVDQEIPTYWARPDRNGEGALKDLVKLAFAEIKGLKGFSGVSANEYEMTVTNIKLKLVRGTTPSLHADSDRGPSQISQATYLGSYDPENPNLVKSMLPVLKEDVQNLIQMALINSNFVAEADQDDWEFEENEDFETAEVQKNKPEQLDQKVITSRLKSVFNSIQIDSLRVAGEGLPITLDFLPANCRLDVCALKVGKHVKSVFIPTGRDRLEDYKNGAFNERVKAVTATLTRQGDKTALAFYGGDEVALNEEIPLLIDKQAVIHANVDSESLENAKSLNDILLSAQIEIQGSTLSGKLPWNQVEIDTFHATPSNENALWIFKNALPLSLPSDPLLGDAILLPKSYRSAGVLIGDRGHLSYQTPTASTIQEQRVPIYIAGFYDPGILPLGGKIILANQYITSMIRSSYPTDHSPLGNGINVRMDDIGDAESVKSKLEAGFKEAGIDKYWKVETFREFEFTKDFLQQLRSEKNLFSLISIIVIIVACSNIVSMLIILVNNKKLEIGILRSMGASSTSIALIFGTCGIVMGLSGSIIGLTVALITLRNLQSLIDLISKAQGFDMFNPVYYGETLPNQISLETLTFVIGATVLISLVAGVIPAVKASLMRPSAILRSE